MTQLTNGQHACVLVIGANGGKLWTDLVTVIFFLCTWWTLCFTPRLMQWARVHYRSVKCDVSFSQGSVSMLFGWGEHVIRVCAKIFFLLTAVLGMCETALFLLPVWNLTVGTVKMVNVRHRAKSRGDRSNCCGDITIFRFFKMAGADILDF